MKVYVCYELDCDAYNSCFDKVVKVVATEEQAISWTKEGCQTELGPSNTYEEFEVEE